MKGKPTLTWSRHLVYTLPWFTLKTTFSKPGSDFMCIFHALNGPVNMTYKKCHLLACNIRLSGGRHQRLEETCSFFLQGRRINCHYIKVGSTVFHWNICICETTRRHNHKDSKLIFIFNVNIIQILPGNTAVWYISITTANFLNFNSFKGHIS